MKKTLFIFIIFILFTLASRALAASVFTSLPSNVGVGDTFEILVNADTGGELINSISLTLDYDESLMSFSGYKDENAVVKLWLIFPREREGAVYMTGIIPGGVSGVHDPNRKGLSPIPLARLLFTAKAEGEAEFSFTKTEILKNDGKGTALVFEEKGGSLVIKNTNLNTNLNNDDKIPPEPFTITFLESSLFSRTPRMLIFEARDAGSGIREYKIKIGSGEWREAQSPQPISKNIFPRNVTIRALDFYGNFQDAGIYVPGFVPTKFLIIIGIVLLLSGILAFKLLKYKA